MAAAKDPELAECRELSRSILGHALIGTFRSHCLRVQQLLTSLIMWRYRVAEGVTGFLFDGDSEESEIGKMLSDTGSAVRQSLKDVGAGYLMSALFGEDDSPPSAPPVSPHLRFILESQGGKNVDVDVVDIQSAVPFDEQTAWAVPTSFLGGDYGRLRVDAIRCYGGPPTNDGEAENGGAAASAWVDFRAMALVGASPGLVAALEDIHEWQLRGHSWITGGGGSTSSSVATSRRSEKHKRCFLETFPNMAEFAATIVKLQAVEWESEEQGDNGVSKVTLRLPFDQGVLQQTYPRFGDLIALCHPMWLKFRHSASGALIAEFKLQGSLLKLVKYMKDGEDVAVAEDGSVVRLALSELTDLVADAEVEIGLVPLGEDGPAIPLPIMKLRCKGEWPRVRVTCLEAKECSYEDYAGFAFDFALFRKLLVEAFLLDGSLVEDQAGAPVLRICFRILFPTSSVSQMLAQWFRGFVKAQLEEFDILKVGRDFLAALCKDLETGS
eukprot:TRINITY_DN40220_c0_g1_i1.p1 TRINITY_DN40220_c0_g1~~TRINITY_DN40220_c0_g1_i1.p1  ORF type:complete len:497 (+),score=101.13 TRINITY_DN40220_c0_g1_i1:117-1607(+)